jgi:hypothetical protein
MQVLSLGFIQALLVNSTVLLCVTKREQNKNFLGPFFYLGRTIHKKKDERMEIRMYLGFGWTLVNILFSPNENFPIIIIHGVSL